MHYAIHSVLRPQKLYHSDFESCTFQADAFHFILLLGQFCTLLDLSRKPPWRIFFAFRIFRAKGVRRCKSSRYLNVSYSWCPIIFLHIIGFSICMQLSKVSDRCYGLTLSPGEQRIAVVCLRLLYPTSFCSTDCCYRWRYVHKLQLTAVFFQVRSLDLNLLNQMYQVR